MFTAIFDRSGTLGVPYKYAPNQKKDYPYKVHSYIDNLRNTFDDGKDRKKHPLCKE